MPRFITGILVFIQLIFFITSNAQTSIKGVVKNPKGKGIYGVSVAIRDSYDGATTDSSGNFSFTTMEKGEQLLTASSVGFKPYEIAVKPEGETISLTINLKEEFTELDAVTISAGTFEASDRKRATAVLDPIDIVTTASANGDITGALKTLPGAQQVGESEGLFVRGGTAAETKTFIDGTLVNNFFYSSVPNIAQFSRFSPFIFKGTVFSTGGYSALYGQALSSALILESIDLPDRAAANIGISVLGANAGFQQLDKNKRSSWGLNYGYTDLSLAFGIMKQKQDYSKAPAYHNADANFRIKTSKTGMLKYYGYFSANKLGFTTASIDSLNYFDKFAISNTNHYHNLAWRENIGRKWKINIGLSYTNNQDDIRSGMQDNNEKDVLLAGLEGKNFHIDTKGDYLNAKLVIENRLKGLSSIRFGTEYNFSKDRLLYSDYNGNVYPGSLRENIYALFAESDIYITHRLAAKTGVRFERSSQIDQSNIAPRVSVAYKLAKGTQASVAYGIFYQNPERKYLPSPYGLDFMKATHYIAQFQRVINQQSFRTEIFYKKYKGLVKTSFTNFQETAVNNDGYGDAKGIEFFWRDKKSIRNLDYWISYSYLDTKRDFLNFPYAIRPNFAARHTSSLVVKRFVQNWKMNLNGAYNYASGRPYYDIRYDGSTPKFNDRGEVPDYHNVSFSINYLPFIGKKNPKSYTVWVLQVSNILNLKQTYGYQYSYNGYRKQAIVPPSRTFVFIGCFISFGVDRSDEIINNAL
jgi:hypothetical protein